MSYKGGLQGRVCSKLTVMLGEDVSFLVRVRIGALVSLQVISPSGVLLDLLGVLVVS